jgi:uncharacterized protein
VHQITFMKKSFLLSVILLLFYFAKSQSITGNWEGSLTVQATELPIIFHIKKDSADKLTATFDSPKQQAYNLACSDVILTGDSVILMMKLINGKYEGLLSTDKKMLTGNWTQGGGSLPLIMKKTSDVAAAKEIKRPQTPKPPFNYYTEDVSYFNAGKSIQFGGTFTRPLDKVLKKYPAVLLITGSGMQDRDETIFDHKPFAVMANYLTKQGIAVLRVDDRGKGLTTGNFATSTTADFAKDVEAGMDYLKTLRNVDAANIGLIGHSEGGMIAPMVASKRKDVKFIILLAGPGVPIIDLMEKQNVQVMTSGGMPKEQSEQYIPLYKNLMATVMNELDTMVALKKATDVFTDWQNQTSKETVQKITNVTDEKSRTHFIADFIDGMKSPWFRYFMKFKPADYLSKVNCAVLALNGEKDIQVDAKQNLAAIRIALPAKTNATIKEMPGLNHLFQHCKTCSVQEYADLEETFSPEVLEIMAQWVKRVTK